MKNDCGSNLMAGVAIAGNSRMKDIRKIREFQLEKICLSDEFDVLQIVGEGWFGKILLVEHKTTEKEMVLKALPKQYASLTDFYREFHYSLVLGTFKRIVTTFSVAFETPCFYVFAQEYAPLGDLTANVSENGIGELYSKRVAKQLASAVEFIHCHNLVHRDVKLDNILVFKSDFSRIKLCDMGETRKAHSHVRRRNEWLPYCPPEVLPLAPDQTYRVEPSQDVWQFAIVLFVCLTGCLPWQKASSDDPRYASYALWHGSGGVLMAVRKPKMFKLVSAKAQKLFRKFLQPKSEKRPTGLAELNKYLDDRWLDKSLSEKQQNGDNRDGADVLCPSMYSFHSSLEEKNKLLKVLTEHGIETTVDRSAKKARIRQWIQSSVIREENEDFDEGNKERLEIASDSLNKMISVKKKYAAATSVSIDQDYRLFNVVRNAKMRAFESTSSSATNTVDSYPSTSKSDSRGVLSP